MTPLKQWIAALRSGEYKQGQGQLTRIEDSKIEHCCLGVACELFIKQNPGELIVEDKYITNDIRLRSYDGVVASLPFAVSEWLNITNMEISGIVHLGDSKYDNVVHMNDDGKTFIEIADFLEQNVKENV